MDHQCSNRSPKGPVMYLKYVHYRQRPLTKRLQDVPLIVRSQWQTFLHLNVHFNACFLLLKQYTEIILPTWWWTQDKSQCFHVSSLIPEHFATPLLWHTWLNSPNLSWDQPSVCYGRENTRLRFLAYWCKCAVHGADVNHHPPHEEEKKKKEKPYFPHLKNNRFPSVLKDINKRQQCRVRHNTTDLFWTY